jgi:hypothetical protein
MSLEHPETVEDALCIALDWLVRKPDDDEPREEREE